MTNLNIIEGLHDFFFGSKKASRKEFTAAVNLCCAASEYSVRSLCFEICVNMIAAAFGRCDFRTYYKGKEVRDWEHWLWNIEPNVNQNSTAFLHKLIYQLYSNNEALILKTGSDKLVVADSFQSGDKFPEKQNEYSAVTVGDFTYKKTFREKDVMHLVLNNKDVKPILDGIAMAQEKMIQAAEQYFFMQNGGKLKVHVDTIASNAEGFKEDFKKMIENQVKPFFENANAVLPEFDGYKYEIFGKDGSTARAGSDDVRALIADTFNMTAQGFLIPAVLADGKVEATGDANDRFMSRIIDPLADQLQEEVNRKWYGFEYWKEGSYLRIDTSSIMHFDIFANAANVEKVIGSATFTVNDVRRAAGQDEIDEPWANTHFMTRNIGAVKELLTEAAGRG